MIGAGSTLEIGDLKKGFSIEWWNFQANGKKPSSSAFFISDKFLLALSLTPTHAKCNDQRLRQLELTEENERMLIKLLTFENQLPLESLNEWTSRTQTRTHGQNDQIQID